MSIADTRYHQQTVRRWPRFALVALAAIHGCAGRNTVTAAKIATPEPASVVSKLVSHRKPLISDPTLIESESLIEPHNVGSRPATPSPVPEPWQSDLQPSPVSSVTMGPRDAGQEPHTFQDVTLASVLQIAFASSPVVRSIGGRIIDQPEGAKTIFDVEIVANDPFFGPQAALAQFDSVVGAGLNSANNDRVFNNVVLGGNAQELVQDVASANATWQRRNQHGTLFDIRGVNGYDANNRSGNLFPSYWETQLEAGVRKPLMRGAGREFNTIAGPNAQPGFNFSNGIVLAQMNTQLEQADFEIAVQRFTRELHAAYWTLHRTYRSYDNLRQTRDLAYDTWQTLKAKANQGLEGGQIDKEAQARQKYYRYQRAVVASLGGADGQIGLYDAERQLRHLMGLPLLDVALLRPCDAVPVAPIFYDWESLVASSMFDRVELRRQMIKVRQQQLKLVASKNFLLPQLDLIGRYRVRGFGDELIGDGPRFASSYDDFFSLDHQEFEFGVEWGNTVGRRQARAAVRNASLLLQRECAVLAEQQRELTMMLSDAVSRTRSTYLTLESSQQELAAAEARTRATRVLYEVDKTDLFMLLDARESQLQVNEQSTADQVQYALALVDVAYQSGRLLRDAGITLTCTDARVVPMLVPQVQAEETSVLDKLTSPYQDIEMLPAPRL